MIHIQSYQYSKNRIVPMWDFGLSAQFACAQECKDYLLLEDEETIGRDSDCLIGSVEWCSNYLKFYNYPVPSAIDLFQFQPFLQRQVKAMFVAEFLNKAGKEIPFPIFIKPHYNIKLFTGTQVLNLFDAELVLKDIPWDTLLSVQEVIDPIQSEWRVYVNRRRILACKHYKGDSLVFPDSRVIKECVYQSLKSVENISFTLDFGVDKDGVTFLIEPNDGWAIGNYGLEPVDYLNFCIDRWKQITGKL